MKKLLFLVRVALVAGMVYVVCFGCGRNPLGCGPLPPVCRESTFSRQIDALSSPSRTEKWIVSMVKYDLDHNTGWSDSSQDQAYDLAYSLWSTYEDGKCRGVCGQMAAMFVVAAREHGYRCGGVVYWNATAGHAEAWIEERDGTISMTSNERYVKSVYKNYEEFELAWIYWLENDKASYGYLLNDRFERVRLLE